MNKLIRVYSLGPDVRHYMAEFQDATLCGLSINMASQFWTRVKPRSFDCCWPCTTTREKLIRWSRMVKEPKGSTYGSVSYPIKEASPPEERFIYFDDLLTEVLKVMEFCLDIDDIGNYQHLEVFAIHLDLVVQMYGEQIANAAIEEGCHD